MTLTERQQEARKDRVLHRVQKLLDAGKLDIQYNDIQPYKKCMEEIQAIKRKIC